MRVVVAVVMSILLITATGISFLLATPVYEELKQHADAQLAALGDADASAAWATVTGILGGTWGVAFAIIVFGLILYGWLWAQRREWVYG